MSGRIVVTCDETLTDEMARILRTASGGDSALGRSPCGCPAWPPTGSLVFVRGEYGRLLAVRDRLIASGVDPEDLETLEPPL